MVVSAQASHTKRPAPHSPHALPLTRCSLQRPCYSSPLLQQPLPCCCHVRAPHRSCPGNPTQASPPLLDPVAGYTRTEYSLFFVPPRNSPCSEPHPSGAARPLVRTSTAQRHTRGVIDSTKNFELATSGRARAAPPQCYCISLHRLGWEGQQFARFSRSVTFRGWTGSGHVEVGASTGQVSSAPSQQQRQQQQQQQQQQQHNPLECLLEGRQHPLFRRCATIE